MKMKNSCYLKEIFIYYPYVEGVSVNLTLHQDGTYKLGGVEGLFMQLLLDYLGVMFKVITPHNLGRTKAFNISQLMILGRGSLSKYSENANVAYAMDSVTFAVKKTVPLSTRFAFLYPFTLNTWIGILTTWIVLTLFGMFLLKKRLSYLDLCLQMLGCLFRQCYQVSAESIKIRIFLLVWLVFTMVISCSFTAVFFSFMVDPLKNPPMRNFKELSAAVTSGARKCYVYNSSDIFSRFQDSTEIYIKQLAKFTEEKNFNIDYRLNSYENAIKQGIVIVRDSSFLDLIFGMNAEIFISDDRISNRLMSFLYFGDGLCWKNKINVLILRAWSAGLYQKIYKDEQMKHNRATRVSAINSVRPLSLNDISGVIIILGFGLMISFFVLLMEIVVYNCKKMY